MKKILFRSLTFVMAIAVLLSAFVFTPSAANGKSPLRTDAQAREYIEQYANDIDEENLNYCIGSTTQLESFSGEKSYLLYSLLPSGYAVYDEISGIVEEMMLGAESPYKDAGEGIPYYGGPMNYVLKLEDAYYLIGDGTKLTEENIAELTKLEEYTVSNRENRVKGLPHTSTRYPMSSANYFTSLLGDNFGCNGNGTCTHIACAIMLGFYDQYVNASFVPTAYEQNSGTSEDFHLYLQTFLGTGSSGLANAASGLNTYFSAIFFPTPTAYCEIGNHETVYSRVTNRVYNNKPTVIAMFSSYNPDCSMNHSAVAYGYREELLGPELISAAYYVHNGWHNSKLGTYAWDWFADDLYIA